MATGTAPIFQAATSATKCSTQFGRQTAIMSSAASPPWCSDAARRPDRSSSSRQVNDRSRPWASTSETAGSSPACPGQLGDATPVGDVHCSSLLMPPCAPHGPPPNSTEHTVHAHERRNGPEGRERPPWAAGLIVVVEKPESDPAACCRKLWNDSTSVDGGAETFTVAP